MLDIKENVELAPLTTLKIGGKVDYFALVNDLGELKEALSFAGEKGIPFFIMAGGSNVLFSDKGFSGLVIQINLLGREVLKNDVDEVVIKVGAGEKLDEIVEWTVDSQWWGIENLSFIPGKAGALVIQNVNAYGTKAEEIVTEVEVFDTKDGEVKTFKNKDCHFGYRSSIFNTSEKGRYVILYITILLDRLGDANTKYLDVKKFLGKKGIQNPSIRQMRSAVVAIRKRKGQDTSKYMSAGSFFKNLLLEKEEYRTLLQHISKNWGDSKVKEIDDIRRKFSEEGEIKVPLAYILDRLLDLKGQSVGGAKLNEMQVLNLINTGRATAKDVMELFKKVRRLVYEKTGMEIVNEPELVGFRDIELTDYFSLG